MNRNRGALAAVLIAVSTLAGCTGGAGSPKSGPRTTTIEVSYEELLENPRVSRDIALSVGDFLQISLGSNASTGYRWSAAMTVSDPKVLTQTGHETVGPAEDRPGAAGREVWVLQATAAGATSVSASYGRPWQGGEQDSWTFTADVRVK